MRAETRGCRPDITANRASVYTSFRIVGIEAIYMDERVISIGPE